MLKQMYSALAFFSTVNFLALLGLAAYAYFVGKLDHTKVEAITAVFRTSPEGASAADAAAPGTAPSPQGSTETSAKKIADTIQAAEMERLQTDRAKAELKQFQVLWDRRMLKLQKDQEAFEAHVAEYDRHKEDSREQEQSSAYEKTITTIGSMAPKKALEVLMNQSTADALKVLLSLNDRQRTRILESCKTAQQLEWRTTVMDAMLRQRVASDQ